MTAPKPTRTVELRVYDEMWSEPLVLTIRPRRGRSFDLARLLQAITSAR